MLNPACAKLLYFVWLLYINWSGTNCSPIWTPWTAVNWNYSTSTSNGPKRSQCPPALDSLHPELKNRTFPPKFQNFQKNYLSHIHTWLLKWLTSLLLRKLKHNLQKNKLWKRRTHFLTNKDTFCD